MWLTSAFASAALLGLYDAAKKKALTDNAVLPVLWLNTLFSTLLFLPAIFTSAFATGWLDGTPLAVGPGSLHDHALVFLKSAIVLTSWIFGYIGIKHLPLTIVGPINATRPVLVLVGAFLLFGERLNAFQWTGVALALASLLLLSRSGRREGVDFVRNRWIGCIALAALAGAASGLYAVFVQSWFNLYQLLLMTAATTLLHRFARRRPSTPFRWSWAIPLISILLSLADFAYYAALRDPEAMISVVSMIRRGSVAVSFLCGAVLFRERNLRAKAVDLVFILAGMVFLWLGSRPSA